VNSGGSSSPYLDLRGHFDAGRERGEKKNKGGRTEMKGKDGRKHPLRN